MTEIDPKLSRLYREASSEEPPAALDEAVLEAARMQAAKSRRLHAAEGHEQPQRRERSFWSRWIVPAGAIATLALGVSIAFLVEREQPATVDGSRVRPLPPPPQSWPPAPLPEAAKPKADNGAAAETAAKKEAPASPAPASPAPAQAPDLGTPAQALEPAAAARVPPANLQAPAPAPSAAEAFPAESRAKTAVPATGAPKAASGADAGADAAFGAPKSAIRSNAGADAALGGPAGGAPAAAAGESAPMPQQATARAPEAWLDEISRLKREGHEKEAAELMAGFRKTYPLYPLPESLRGLQ